MDTQRSILAQLVSRPASLADLGAATGVSLPTLRRAVQELGAGRWIRVVGREEGTGGRPANLFGLDTDVHTLIGVHLAHPGMRIVATDLTGAILDDVVPGGLFELEPDAVHAAVADFLAGFRRRRPERRPLGIGVATPGYVDPVTGTVITIGRVPTWSNLPLCDRLHEATGLRIAIGNDMDALATAEFGFGEEARTYAYVGYGEGAKFSMFLDGVPYTGPFGNAGLVSPTLLAQGGGPDDAALLRVRGLVDAYERAADPTAPRNASHDRAPDAVRRRFDEILELAAGGDPVADRVVARTSEVLGAQIAAFVHLIQPGLLVIGGALAGAPAPVLDRIEAAVRSRLPTLLDNALIVRQARVAGPEGTALGATRLLLQRFLAEDAEPVASLAR